MNDESMNRISPVVLSKDLESQMKEARDAMRDKVLKDPVVRELLNRNGLPDDAAEDYLSSLAKAIDSRKVCRDCVSVEYCPYHPKGFKPEITVHNGCLTVHTRACGKMLRKNEEEKYLSNYLYSSVKKKDLALSMKELLAENHEDGSVDLLRMYVSFKEWMNDPDRQGLYLYGPSGSGKTYYASAIANDLAKEGKRIAYFNVLTLAQQLRGNLLSQDEMREMIRLMKTADVLVLDGIGAETVTSAWRDMILLPVLEYLSEEENILIVTSYGNYDDLTDHFTNTVFRETDQNKADMIKTRIETLTRPVKVSRR